MFDYQHEKIGAAVYALMSLTMSNSRRIMGAMHELDLAFRNDPPPVGSEQYLEKIHSIMRGSGSYEEKASLLNETQLHELSKAFWELYEAVCRAHHEPIR